MKSRKITYFFKPKSAGSDSTSSTSVPGSTISATIPSADVSTSVITTFADSTSCLTTSDLSTPIVPATSIDASSFGVSPSNVSELSSASVQSNLIDSCADSGPPMKVRRVAPVSSSFSSKDIAHFCNKKLSDSEKYDVLENVWVPDSHFIFPFSAGARRVRFQLSYLTKFPWLVYSAVDDGAYCKFCALFHDYKGVGKGNHHFPRLLVRSPFFNWNKALETFRKHQAKEYHMDAIVDGLIFRDNYKEQRAKQLIG